jgi:tetratricopeptide (TPR) repeat protein
MPHGARIAWLLGLFCFFSPLWATENAAEQLRKEWAVAAYQTPAKKQLKTLSTLMDEAKALQTQYPDDPDIMLWSAMILTTYASVKGPTALTQVKEARELLQQALEIDPDLEEGLAESLLGYLYAHAPNWPIAFGNKQKARQHLEHALRMNPEGMDPNFYFADFLMVIGEFNDAKTHFEIAKKAPIRPDYEIQDQGRKKEIKANLKKLKKLGKH